MSDNLDGLSPIQLIYLTIEDSEFGEDCISTEFKCRVSLQGFPTVILTPTAPSLEIPVFSVEDSLNLLFLDSRSEIIGSISFPLGLLAEHRILKRWITLFDPEDDKYDGDFFCDDLECPRVLLSFHMSPIDVPEGSYDGLGQQELHLPSEFLEIQYPEQQEKQETINQNQNIQNSWHNPINQFLRDDNERSIESYNEIKESSSMNNSSQHFDNQQFKEDQQHEEFIEKELIHDGEEINQHPSQSLHLNNIRNQNLPKMDLQLQGSELDGLTSSPEQINSMCTDEEIIRTSQHSFQKQIQGSDHQQVQSQQYEESLYRRYEEVSMLEKEVLALRAALTGRDANLRIAEQRINQQRIIEEQMRGKIFAFSQLIEDLQLRNEEYEKDLERMSDSFTTSAKTLGSHDISKCLQEMKRFDQEIIDLQEEIERRGKLEIEQEGRIKEMELTIKIKDKNIDQLQKQSYKLTHNDKEEEICTLPNQEILTEDKQSLKNFVDKAEKLAQLLIFSEKEKEDWKKKYEIIEQDFKKMAGEVSLREQAEQMRRQLAEKLEEVVLLKEENNQFKESYESLKGSTSKTVEYLNQVLGQKQREIEQLHLQADTTPHQLPNLLSKLQEASERENDLIQQISKLKEREEEKNVQDEQSNQIKKQQIEKEYEGKILMIQENINKYEMRVIEYQEIIIKLEDDITEYCSSIKLLEQKLQEREDYLSKEQEMINEQNIKYKQEIEEFNCLNASLQSQIHLLNEDKILQEDKAQENKEKHTQEIFKILKDHQNELVNSSDTITSLKEQLESCKLEKQSLHLRVMEMNKHEEEKSQKSNSQIKASSFENQELKSKQIEKYIQEFTDKSDKEIAILKSEYLSKLKILEDELYEKDNILKDNMQQIKMMNEQLVLNEIRFLEKQDIEKEREAQRIQKQSIENQINFLKDALRLSEARLNEKESELIKYKNMNNENIAKLNQIESQIQNVQQLETKLKDSELKRIAIQQNFNLKEYDANQYLDTIKERDNQLISINLKLKQKEQDMTEKNEQVNNMVDQIHSYEQRMLELRQELSKKDSIVKSITKEKEDYFSRMKTIQKEESDKNKLSSAKIQQLMIEKEEEKNQVLKLLKIKSEEEQSKERIIEDLKKEIQERKMQIEKEINLSALKQEDLLSRIEEVNSIIEQQNSTIIEKNELIQRELHFNEQLRIELKEMSQNLEENSNKQANTFEIVLKLEQENKELKMDYQQLEQSKQLINEMTIQLEVSKIEIIKLTDLLNKENENNSILLKNESKWSESISILEKKRNQLAKELDEMEKNSQRKIESQELLLLESTMEISIQKNLNSQLLEEINQMNEDKKEMWQEVYQMEERSNNINQELKEYREIITNLEQDKKQLKATLQREIENRLISEVNSIDKNNIEEQKLMLEEELTQLRKQLHNISQQKKEEYNLLEKQMKIQKEQQLEQEKQIIANNLKLIEKDHAIFKEEKIVLGQTILELSLQEEVLSDKINKLSTENTTLAFENKQFKEIIKNNAYTQDERATFQIKRSQDQSQIAELKSQIEELLRQVKYFEEKVNNYKLENQALATLSCQLRTKLDKQSQELPSQLPQNCHYETDSTFKDQPFRTATQREEDSNSPNFENRDSIEEKEDEDASQQVNTEPDNLHRQPLQQTQENNIFSETSRLSYQQQQQQQQQSQIQCSHLGTSNSSRSNSRPSIGNGQNTPFVTKKILPLPDKNNNLPNFLQLPKKQEKSISTNTKNSLFQLKAIALRESPFKV